MIVRYMHLYCTAKGVVVRKKSDEVGFLAENWDDLFAHESLPRWLKDQPLVHSEEAVSAISESLLPPIESQEVWACGVTYFSSRLARIEESKEAGGGDFYARVYNADRPEIFFKATSARVAGHGQSVRIRQDSRWNVPEPELALVLSTSGKIIGYTVGNDMSSRDIEGENPLYLPQAKTYEKCAGLGPGLYVPEDPINLDTRIALSVKRAGDEIFTGETRLSEMKRSLDELVDYINRELVFPNGAFLMTGTGIIPESDFTLLSGDEISISIDEVGQLVQTVE